MRTLPVALLWEVSHRGRWWLPASALGAIALPLLLFAALQRNGALNPRDPEILVVQSVMMQIGMLMIGAATFNCLGRPSRLFTRPIGNAGLALAHLLPAGVITAAVWTLCTLFLNSVLPLDWPLLGPALFAAVAVPAFISVCWFTEKSFWLLPTIAGTGVILGAWFKSRFGPAVGSPTHLWRNVTGVDFTLLLAVAAAVYIIGVRGIALRRRDEALSGFELQVWLEKLLDRVLSADTRFSSPQRAQLWAEQRRKGWVLPGLYVLCSLMALALWLLVSRSPQTLLEGVTAAGMTIAVAAGLISAFAFNLGSTDTNWSIGPFLGTRPISSATLARCVMTIQFRSVAITTALWLMTCLGAYAQADPMIRSQGASAWLILALVACPWICASVGSTIALTGRAQYFAAAFLVILFSLYAFAGAVQLAAPREAKQELLQTAVLSTICILSTAAILGTLWAFAQAIRRGMLERKTVVRATLVAATLASLVVWGLVANERTSPLIYLAGAGCVALAVAPWATAPLAVAWNRSR